MVDVPSDADLLTTGFAISLKDKNGMDLMVAAMHDYDIRFRHTGRNIVRINFPIYLNVGEYTLTTGLEMRDTLPISYYDYIEGAAYIKTMCDKEYFGVMKVPAEIAIGE